MSEHQPESDEPAGGTDFDPYRYGRPDPNPTHDAFGRPIPAEPHRQDHLPPGGYPPAPPWQQTGPQLPGQQPPGYSGYSPPPGYRGYPPPARTNGMATAGLVLGIVSLVLCWLSVLDVPLVILGITFAAVGLARARRGAGSHGMAMAGLICSLVAALIVTVILIVLVPKYVDCYHKHHGNSEQIRRCLTGD